MKFSRAVTGRRRAALRWSAAFTLIELLVVLGIITILMALLTPIVNRTLGSAHALRCLSNLRQWGLAGKYYQGDNHEFVPWDGNDDVGANLAADTWWANALPAYVGEKGFAQRRAAGQHAPLPPQTSIFLDAAARLPAGSPYTSGSLKFFFCYVMNSKLNSAAPAGQTIRHAQILRPAATIQMVEMRTTPAELPPNDPFYGKALNRCKADWQRYAARHNNGGHLVFADGHAAFTAYSSVTQPTSTKDYNQPGLIWNPLGPAQ